MLAGSGSKYLQKVVKDQEKVTKSAENSEAMGRRERSMVLPGHLWRPRSPYTGGLVATTP